ncbi:response regulator transcription factor [Sporomusa acidovorans]|uniref:Transcriptional regulatory protein SrrA n=1 Tax=Sporomusa acidovorans (strain ATCC 49682 / DSM 3132 / Mol) TaxID=1123286 RepID=A0ABZ3IXZ3_SPOA4|nr:response regulator transcription factor [Sporomusa acidovorans]OZC17704.1 transcriptional regulatory protein SrrA [Sporomusa acidovorans DSM 3132]SDE12483.1 DNA-binding response regulator, OmpR family, contains REC and winged-helix (wHTH) domain [Sporomusa acidovorans]
MREQTILIVDDDKNIREILALYFTKENFTVEEAADGVEAIRKIEQRNPSMILLDIMMPVLDGIEVCRQIRKFSRVPIIMLTARAEDEDRIMGLELGADDYITKPFNPREVVARVNAVLRRVPDSEFMKANVLHFTNLEVNINEHTITTFGQTVPLTSKEMELLWCLASHPGRTFSREMLLEKVWGYTYCGETRTVDSHIKRLRQKLGIKDTSPWDIQTVWGVGYRFEVRP